MYESQNLITENVNVGQSNSLEGRGHVLSEIIFRMRIINITCSVLALLLELPSLIGDLFVNPGRMVLGGYLSFFALILCCFELNTPTIQKPLEDKFGLIMHPLGRSFFLFLMGGLCLGQGGLQAILGFVLMGNAIYTTYVFLRYPDYRKMHEEQPDLVSNAADKVARFAWANPQKSFRYLMNSGEQQGLISK
eukprot:CAMPEP_0118691276 /NCGR_PEP_ID=MMETSP0800-20121206/10586_1 /TAXON_ID=210618 ORGANISM="Striatella unipunctata, Strain CCMP2910" /NCGR_SAMPLE_ID=MMETSP0800 /ASSEMBLY_ACC=CAM_ASM_000638 /LENGTH=191 /DNA_ID=CAMNT_0006589029 /DNA_START=138 /DNA_END=713 /DNA_ORIENTATION=-